MQSPATLRRTLAAGRDFRRGSRLLEQRRRDAPVPRPPARAERRAA